MNWKNIVKIFGGALLILALVTYFLNNYLNISWFPQVIVAWGTLVFAYITYLSIQANERHIKENRRETALDRVRNWARNGIRLFAVTEIDKISGRDSNQVRAIETLRTRLQIVKAESAGLSSDALIIGGQFKENVNNALEDLNSCESALSEQNININVLFANFYRLNKSFYEIINTEGERTYSDLINGTNTRPSSNYSGHDDAQPFSNSASRTEAKPPTISKGRTPSKPSLLSVSDWITFLSNEKHGISGAILTYGTVIIALLAVLLSVGFPPETPPGAIPESISIGQILRVAVVSLGFVLYYLIAIRPFQKKINEAEKILDRIMAGELTDPDDIRDAWDRATKSR
jgi:hypothetical protein